MIHPVAVARATGRNEHELRKVLADKFGLAIGETFTASQAPDALMQAPGKSILVEDADALLAGTKKTPSAIAAALTPSEVCEDILTFFKRLEAALAR